jgi:hypothetical protein
MSRIYTWCNPQLMANLDSVIQELRDERARLDQAIATLEGIAHYTAQGSRPRLDVHDLRANAG